MSPKSGTLMVKTGCRGLEEFQYRIESNDGELKRSISTWACQGFFQPICADRIDTDFRCGSDHLVVALTQNGDALRANQAGAADHDDFHS
jgi:hypothetical protein